MADVGYVWQGTANVDFIQGQSPRINTAGLPRAFNRSTYSNTNGVNSVRSTTFPGGAIASGWFSCQANVLNTASGLAYVGVGQSTTNNGLIIGINNSTGSKWCISTWDGSTKTDLASESGTTVITGNRRIDLQVISFGASATIHLYVDYQYEQCDGVNPVTGNPYTLSELNALQGNLEALT